MQMSCSMAYAVEHRWARGGARSRTALYSASCRRQPASVCCGSDRIICLPRRVFLACCRTSQYPATRRRAPPCPIQVLPVPLEHSPAASETASGGRTRLSPVFSGTGPAVARSERARRSRAVAPTADRAKTAHVRLARPLHAFGGCQRPHAPEGAETLTHTSHRRHPPPPYVSGARGALQPSRAAAGGVRPPRPSLQDLPLGERRLSPPCRRPERRAGHRMSLSPGHR